MRTSRALVLAAWLGGAAAVADEPKPVPPSLVGWYAFYQDGKWKPCRKVDAKLGATLKALGCKWETPLATPAVVCHEKGDAAWVAFATAKACRAEWEVLQAD